MSKNFELLQKLGSDHKVFDIENSVAATPKDSVPPSAPPSHLQGAELQQITELVQRLNLQAGADAPRMIVFTGLEPSSGCSWVCACTGETLASQVSGSVCVVDTDLRAPGLHNHFGMTNSRGLSDALQGAESIRHFVQATSRHNVQLLSSGSGAENVQGLLSSGRMRLRMTELRSRYDYVLINAAPLSVSDDAIMLGPLADGVVLVLKANSSRRETARKAVENLQAAQVKVLGAVLNQRTFPIPEKIYKKL